MEGKTAEKLRIFPIPSHIGTLLRLYFRKLLFLTRIFFEKSSEFGEFHFQRGAFLPKIEVFTAQYCKRLIGYFYRRIISVSAYQSVNSDSKILK